MTNEEIDALEAGRELDYAIAENVFKWHTIEIKWHNSEGGVVTQRWLGPPEVASSTVPLVIPTCPYYSTDISDAWHVVEHLNANCEIDMFIESWSDGEWIVASHPVGYSTREPSAKCDGKKTGKPSLPLAICRWALKRSIG